MNPRRSDHDDRYSRRAARERSLVGKALGRVSRYSDILRVLVRYGFADVVRKVDAAVYRRLGGPKGEARRSRRRWSRPERVRRVLEELGPTFVKIGQLLSHRPDLVPQDWILEFEKLRGQVPPAPLEGIRQIFVEDFGSSPEQIFEGFNPDPVASGSVAQVYRARLRLDREAGEAEGGRVVDVAVKVQRPGIRKVIEGDLAILRDLARIVERRIPALAAFAPVDAVRELERALRSELDFRNEEKNLKAFRKGFKNVPEVTAPKPYGRFSGRRILVMGWIDGIPVGDSRALADSPANPKIVARRGADAVLRQIFDHRLFHSDPHGGNILILPDNRIAFLDFGQMGSILPSQRRFLADLVGALLRRDAPRAVRTIFSWSGYRDPDEVRRFIGDMEIVMERYLNLTFGDLDVGDMVNALFDLIRRYAISVPSNFYLLAKAMATIEDIAESLDPEFDFIRAVQPFARRMIRAELSAERLAENAAGMAGDTLRLIRDLPGETADLLNLLKAGKLRMEFELKDLNRIDMTIKRMITRLSAAILLAAMIMGSSILVQSLIPPLVFGIPVIGVFGFLASGLVGIFLLIDLWRHR